MNNPIEVSLRRHFEGVEDPRDNRGKEHGTGQLKRDRRICVFFNFDTKHYLLMVILLFQQ